MPNNGLKKHTLNLRDGDWDYLESVYRTRGLATAVIVRTIISKFVDGLRAQEPSDREEKVNVKVDL